MLHRSAPPGTSPDIIIYGLKTRYPGHICPLLILSEQRIFNLTDLLPEKILTLPREEAEQEFNQLSISSQAMMALMAPWEKRQELMILSTRFPELVRSMPVEELFWTIKATGPEDSLPLISAASFEQLQFILDLDWWEKDSFRLDRASAWLLLLFEAGEETVNTWINTLRAKDPVLIPALMRHFIEVQKRPDDMEIEEAKDLLPPFTIDNAYYIAFTNDKLQTLWARVIMKLIELSPGFYRDCMETILTETRTECVETAWKLRCGRLADFGIPDYFSALDIYAPVPPEEARQPSPGAVSAQVRGLDEMPAFVPTLYVADFPALRSSLERLADTPHMARIIREWTGAANKIIMADRVDLDDPDIMKKALLKTASLINLGIETTAEARGAEPPEKLLVDIVLEDLVRAAVWRLSGIRNRAHRLARTAGFEQIPDEYHEQFKALNSHFPEVWDSHAHETTAFSSLDQVLQAEKMLDELEAWKKIMEHLKPQWSRWKETIAWEDTNFLSWAEFNWRHGLATAAANYMLDKAAVVVPVPDSRLGMLRDILASDAWKETADRMAEEMEKITAIDREMARLIVHKSMAPLREELLSCRKDEKPDGRFISSFLVEIQAAAGPVVD